MAFITRKKLQMMHKDICSCLEKLLIKCEFIIKLYEERKRNIIVTNKTGGVFIFIYLLLFYTHKCTVSLKLCSRHKICERFSCNTLHTYTFD